MYKKITPSSVPNYPKNPLAPQPVDNSKIETISTAEAVVLDVVVNEDHEYFAEDGYNVGSIKVRIIQTDSFKDLTKLEWAFPIDSSSEEWPLKNEIVRVFRILNRLYYTKKVNIGNYSSNQAMLGLEPELAKAPNSSQSIKRIKQSRHTPINVSERPPDQLGEYFEDIDEPRLRHLEGDQIHQGRSGQSIRIGSTFLDGEVSRGVFKAKSQDQSATIVVTVGHDDSKDKVPDNEFGRYIEDFDKDKTSLWMTEDAILTYEPSTEDASSFRKVSSIPTTLEYNFFSLNTGTFLINTKRNGIHFSSKKDISFSSNKGFYSETDGETKIYSIESGEMLSKDRVSLMAPKVFIGARSNTSQPLVLGNELTTMLVQLLQAIVSSAPTHVITSMGPGSLNPAVVAACQQALSTLRSRVILSDDNFTVKRNEAVG